MLEKLQKYLSYWRLLRNPQQRRTRYLIWRACRGNLSAFDHLVLVHQKTAATLALYMLGDAAVASRVTLLTFLRAFAALPNIPLHVGFDLWLYREILAASKEVLSGYSSHSQEENFEALSARIRMVLDAASARLSNSSFYVHEEEHFQPYLRIFSKLDEEHREVVILRILADFKIEAIGEITGATPGTAQFRLNNAQMKLRNILKEATLLESEAVQAEPDAAGELSGDAS